MKRSEASWAQVAAAPCDQTPKSERTQRSLGCKDPLGQGGSGEEKEMKNVIPPISNRRPRLRRGAEVKTPVLGRVTQWEILRGLWVPGLPPAAALSFQGARADASRGAAQSETATIRVRLHSFESFFPGVWSQPSRTGPGREPERGRRQAYWEEPPQVSRLQICKDGEQTALLERRHNQLPFSEGEKVASPQKKYQ